MVRLGLFLLAPLLAPRIYVLICVGLAVDYAAHIAHMFKERCLFLFLSGFLLEAA